MAVKTGQIVPRPSRTHGRYSSRAHMSRDRDYPSWSYGSEHTDLFRLIVADIPEERVYVSASVNPIAPEPYYHDVNLIHNMAVGGSAPQKLHADYAVRMLVVLSRVLTASREHLIFPLDTK